MKHLLQFRALVLSTISAVIFALCSFSPAPGGEGFEVYRNDQLMLQQFGGDMKNIKTLKLENIRSSDQLMIKYYHCGKVGKNRHIIIRSTDNKELKNWQFANIKTNDAGMRFPPAELFSKSKNTAGKVNVYYTSEEIPAERLLVSLELKS